MQRTLPSGTVTFLFTDVEGSTGLLHALGEAKYADALGEHRRVLRAAFDEHGGAEVDTQGDAFFVAFPTARGALGAARQATEALASGPIRVRIGVHTGTPFVTAEGYVGPDVHRAARVAAAGHGGQVLVSKETRELVEGDFGDLGEHRLKDFAAPVWIFQVGHDRFPPLKTISNTNLPRPASEFVGRDKEVRDVVELVEGGARFVTLTGPGGTGKTRLAIEAAARLIGSYRSGVFWVEAAPLTDPALLSDAVRQTLGARGELAEHVGERQMLLVLDNLEQVADAGSELARLVERCQNLRLMVTSREVLRVRGEREYAVPTLADAEAVALFRTRADMQPDDAVGPLCRALDNLPLAIELAASRASVMSPQQILDRIGDRLDLLRGGRDADPRQRTLRATIDWSHELLPEAERRLFARFSAFAGGATIEAAEAVADADIDLLQSLVDKSLVRHSGERFWMLESIRGYAAERLAASGELAARRRRHADHYLAFSERLNAVIESGEPEEGPVAGLETDMDNLRAAVEFGLAAGDTDLVRRLTAALPMYWIVRGLHREGRAWVDRALTLDDAADGTRRRLLSALATVAYAQGDHTVAVSAADDAAELASDLVGTGDRVAELRARAFAAMQKRDYATAEALFLERLEVALAAGNGVATSSCRLNLASIANATARHERAEELLAENLPFVRSKGQTRCEAYTLASIAETAVYRAHPEEAAEPAGLAAALALDIRDNPLALDCIDTVAVAAAARGDDRAATILGATDALREAMDLPPDEDDVALRRSVAGRLGSGATYSEARQRGAGLDLPAAVELARAVAGIGP